MKANRRPEASSELQLFLRIKHPTLHPDEITDALKLQPEEVRAAGATTQNGTSRLHAESYWIAELPVSLLTEFVETAQSLLRSTERIHEKAARQAQNYLRHNFSDTGLLLTVSLTSLFSRLEAQRSFLQRIAKDGGSVTLLIQQTNSSEALSLSPAVLTKLVALQMGVEIS